MNVKDEYRRLIAIMMNLMSEDDEYAQVQYKQGVKRHGDKAVRAMFKECYQLGDSNKEAFIPMDVSRLTQEQEREALRILTLIRKKRSGKVKGGIVADGRKQRRYMKKEDAGSPTVNLESFLTTLVVNAHEQRDVAILDV